MNKLQDFLTASGWEYHAITDTMVSPDQTNSLPMKLIADMGQPHGPQGVSAPAPVPRTATMIEAQEKARAQQLAAMAQTLVKDPLSNSTHIFDAMMYGSGGMGIKRPTAMPKRFSDYDRLKMRLNMDTDASFGFDFLHIYNGPNTTFVFVVAGEKAIILEDDKSIFPSDKMVAQVRLMQEQI